MIEVKKFKPRFNFEPVFFEKGYFWRQIPCIPIWVPGHSIGTRTYYEYQDILWVPGPSGILGN